MIIIELLWGGLLAALAFWWVSQSSIFQGIRASIWAIVVMGGFGVAASLQFSIFSTVKEVTDLSGLMFWFARKMQHVAVWATVRGIVLASSECGEAVRLSVVRERIAGVIDNHVIDVVSSLSWKSLGQLIGLATGLVALGCYFIR